MEGDGLAAAVQLTLPSSALSSTSFTEALNQG